jgi:hypothetical protein
MSDNKHRLISALLYKYKFNSEATNMGQLDRQRQGLDSTSNTSLPENFLKHVISPVNYDDDANILTDSPAVIMDTGSTIYIKIFHSAVFN